MRTLTLLRRAALCLCLASVAHAGPTPPPVRAEINALLAKLESAGCQFNRNGSWHSGSEARTHLLRKLDYIEGKSTLKSAEQFIEMAASTSSSSGKAYEVKCGSTAAVPSQQWLMKELTALRSAAAPAASAAR